MEKMKMLGNKTVDLGSVAKKLFIAFVILQPIFDIYMCLFDEYVQIAGTSLATILRILMVFVVTVLVMINTRKTKLTLCFAIYVVLIMIYTVIHHFNADGFGVELALAQYNPFSELLYLIRICIPPALIYVIYNIKPKYKDVKLMILSVSVIISSVIIISNLFGFGHVAYVLEKRIIEGNMISWFTETDINWVLLTCRGLFQWTNQISGVMIILLPFVIYVCLKEKKPLFWLFTVMHIVAMINLSTRAAAIGGILIFAGMVFLHIIEKLIQRKSFKKEAKNLLCIVVSAVLVAVIFVNSPIITRSDDMPIFDDIVTGDLNSDKINSDKLDDKEQIDKEEFDEQIAEKLAYIESNLATAGINDLYIRQAYPYTEDCDFWYDIIKNIPEYQRSGNRTMRGYMIERILERDGRISNYIWGISYTRSSSFVWPERDIETHFDSLGIVGMILFLGPYFLALVIGIWYFFKRFKENLRLSRCVYLISLGLGLINAYFSGHVMNEIFPSVYLALVAGMTIRCAIKPEKEEEEAKI